MIRQGAGNNTDLGTAGGFRYSWASSINDAGQIVGSDCDLRGPPSRAILFDHTGAGKNLDLGALGGRGSGATSINNASKIVGWAITSREDDHATLFDPTGAGNNVDLGTLAGYEYSVANSINDAGHIVGWSHNWYGHACATSFDPTGAGNNIDLNTLIDPVSGWTLVCAYDINNSGWIVGSGWNPQGEYHAFLLVPKPPCLYRLVGDMNDDCRVDFADVALMAANWLVDCGAAPTNPACIPK